MKKVLILLALICGYHNGYNQTNVSGGIFSDSSWLLSESPYIVNDNVVVMTGVTLTIEPGVVVKFNDAKLLEVRGTLIANGNENDTIIFTSSSNNPSTCSWSGISFWNELSMSHIKISHACTALVNTNNKKLEISNSRFNLNSTVIDYIGGSTQQGYVYKSLFQNNNLAISSVNKADSISECTFLNNNIGLAYVYNSEILNNVFIGHETKAIDGFGANYVRNTFEQNNVALRIKLYDYGWEVRDNTIINNNIGVQARGDASSTPNSGFINNSICNNILYNVENTDNISLLMENNCWCTDENSEISNKILDAQDNISLGLVDFTPVQSICQPITCINNIKIIDTISICEGDSIYLEGQYQKIEGSYSDTIEVTNFCDTIKTTILKFHPIQITTNTKSICIYDSLFLSGQYQKTSGIYYDTLISIHQCDSIIKTILSIDSVDLTVTQIGDTLIANPNYSNYQWLDCSNYSEISGANEPTYIPVVSGNYSVEISNLSCVDTSICISRINVSVIENELDLNVFPNPTTDIINILFKNPLEKSTIKILDIKGNQIEVIEKNNVSQLQINFDNYNLGIYLIKVESNKGNTTYRVIKK